jgi:hypothetical protein
MAEDSASDLPKTRAPPMPLSAQALSDAVQNEEAALHLRRVVDNLSPDLHPGVRPEGKAASSDRHRGRESSRPQEENGHEGAVKAPGSPEVERGCAIDRLGKGPGPCQRSGRPPPGLQATDGLETPTKSRETKADVRRKKAGQSREDPRDGGPLTGGLERGLGRRSHLVTAGARSTGWSR